MPLEWSKSIETGFPAVDEQHQELFKRINAFVALMMEGKDARKISELIDFLESYAQLHFSFEENLLEQNKYPQLAAHKAQHDFYKRTISTIKSEYQAHGYTKELSASIHKNLTSWLVNHIQKMDLAWAEHLKKNA